MEEIHNTITIIVKFLANITTIDLRIITVLLLFIFTFTLIYISSKIFKHKKTTAIITTIMTIAVTYFFSKDLDSKEFIERMINLYFILNIIASISALFENQKEEELRQMSPEDREQAIKDQDAYDTALLTGDPFFASLTTGGSLSSAIDGSLLGYDDDD